MTEFKKIIFIVLIFGCFFDFAFARRGNASKQQSSQSETEQSWIPYLKGLFSHYFNWQKTPNQDSKKDENSQSLDEEQKKYQVISIFLDNTETSRLGAVSWGLLKALYHKACPILVTQSLMKNILTCRSLNRYMFNVKYTWDLLKYRKNASVGHPASKKIIPSGIAFHDKDWIIKKVGEFGYLLIPKNLAVSGLNNNLLEKSFGPEDQQEQQNLDYEEIFLEALNNNPENQSNIFAADPNIEWTVFIQGHGIQGTEETRRISGLSFERYKNFLEALEKMGCRLLISDSCYGGGVNAKLAYDKDYYPYDIILIGTGDTFTWEMTGPATIHSKHSNFKQFVELVAQETIDYEKAIALISDPSINFSLIRKNDKDKFKPLSQNIFFLSEKYAQNMHNNKIEIAGDKTVVMIEPENLDSELAILSQKLLAIFMLHTRPYNSIRKITASNVSSEDVVRAFMAISGLEANTFKIIRVAEINDLKNVVISYNPKNKKVLAFYEKDGKNFYIQKDQKGYVDFKTLVEKKVDDEIKDDIGSALMMEYSLKNDKSFHISKKKLIDFVEKNTQLHIAARDGNVKTIETLLELNINEIRPKSFQERFMVRNKDNQTPLHLAALHGRLNAVEKILTMAEKQIDTKEDREALISATDNQGKKPLNMVREDDPNSEKIKNMIKRFESGNPVSLDASK